MQPRSPLRLASLCLASLCLASLCLASTAQPALASSVRPLAHDAVTVPNQRVVLRAKFEGRGLGALRRDLTQRKVRFRALAAAPTAVTDDDGIAAASVTPLESGVFPFTAELLGAKGRPTAHARLHVIDPRRPVAVVDIDGTLSAMPGWKVPLRGGRAETFAGAPELLRALAKTHAIVYLSARDDALMPATRRFLALHRFPSGPLLMNEWGIVAAGQRAQLLPGNHGKFKAAVLKHLRRLGLRLTLGIGDADTDAEAYAGARLQGWIHRPERGAEELLGCQSFPSYDWLAAELRRRGVLR